MDDSDDGKKGLRVKDLKVRYGTTAILNGVNLRIGSGEIVALLGGNGQGKSTLIRAMMGLIPSTGEIVLDQWVLNRLEPHRRAELGMTYVFQSRRVFPSLTVEENLKVAFQSAPDMRTAFASAYAIFPELAHQRTRYAGLLSGGQQQMLALARALCRNPRALLLDEPSSGLSAHMWNRVSDLIRSSTAKEGLAVLIIEHLPDRLRGLADSVYLLKDGLVSRVAAVE